MTAPPAPWYQHGLAFECTRCGNCCTGEPGYVWVDDAEIDAIAAAVGMPRDEFVAVYTKSGPRGISLREKGEGDCTFYDRDRGCTIYSVRPRQCRTWPFWDTNVESPSSWRRAGTTCPGIDRGELVSVEEITQRLKAIRL